MSLENKINSDLKEAMKAKDKVALRGIRAIKSALLLAKTETANTEIDETKEIKILQKLLKQRKDSLEIYQKQDRPDLAVIEEEEIAIISKYLPQQMGADELKPIIQAIISETGASGMQDMGRVMGMASQKLAGKAEGKLISQIVKTILTQ